MNYYRQPIAIETFRCSITGQLYSYPIWSDEDIAEGQNLLNEILEGAEENGVKPEYYIKEFLIEGK
jgi:hypothetical protein